MINFGVSLYSNALPIIALMCPSLPNLFDQIFASLRRSCLGEALALAGVCTLAAIICASVPAQAIEAPDLDEGETMVIRATEAWETRSTSPDGSPDASEGPRSLHFKGNFRLDAPDWFIRADNATLFGAVGDPESIKVTGNPARVWMVDESGAVEVDATAEEIEYFRQNDRLKLKGNAVLVEERNTLRSSSIDYDLNERRLVATGKGGVELTTSSARKSSDEGAKSRVENEIQP